MRRLVASGFGCGLLLRHIRDSDAGSGTVGALAAVALALVLRTAPVWAYVLVVIVFVALSLWSSAPFARGGHDPGWVVIDEQAGTLLAVAGLGGWPFLVGFVVFRVADITKRFPGVGAAERLPGGWGITADDLVAGGYGLAAGWLVTAIL